MRLPSFTAEASLGRSQGTYWAGPSGSADAPGAVRPMFHFGLGFTFRCCQKVPGWGLVCATRRRLPWESCTCVHGQFGPVILCKDNGLAQF
jgi:hypothetical protein